MNPANPNNPMQMRGEQKEGLGAASGKQKSLFSLWQCCAAWGLAAVMFLAGCIQTAPPCIVIRHGGACVLTMAYEGEEQEAKFHFARDSVVWRRAGGPVATRIVLADAKGNVVCSVGGDEFTDRYRNAPGKGERDYALLLSADGIRWLSKKEFYMEAEAIHKLQEEAEARKDWLTRELDARHGL